MGLFTSGSLFIGLAFIPEMIGNIAYYKPLCGLYHELEDAPAKIKEAANAKAGFELVNNCDSYYGYEITSALCVIFFFLAARKGYLLYKSRHFDESIDDEMMMMSAPSSQGYSVDRPVDAKPYEPPRST
jgi:hypothetical protein